jgi:beta-lactamase regulating signal transducer with metallopeptidase domain
MMTDAHSAHAMEATIVLLSVASALAVALAALGARHWTAPRTRGYLWRAALVATGLLILGELTGVSTTVGISARRSMTWIGVAKLGSMSPGAPFRPFGSFRAQAVAQIGDEPGSFCLANSSDRRGGESADEPIGSLSDKAAFVPDENPAHLDVAATLSQPIEPFDHEIPVARMSYNESPELVREASSASPQGGTWHSEFLARGGRYSAAVWLAVAAALLVRVCLLRMLWCHRHRASQRVVDARLLGRVAALSKQLGMSSRVQLFASERWLTPVAWGAWRPAIGLPADFAVNFDATKQDAMLAHELGHLAARDPAWQWLADTVTSLLWWLPWCWWLRRQMRLTAESVADEASLVVAGGPRALAECLILLGRKMIDQSATSYSVTGAFRSTLGQRVEHLLQLDFAGQSSRRSHSDRRARLLAPVMVVFVVVVVVVAGGSAWARPLANSQTGENNMRWFIEHSWRQSLAGVLVSMAMSTGPQWSQAQQPALADLAGVEKDDENTDTHEDASDDLEVLETEKAIVERAEQEAREQAERAYEEEREHIERALREQQEALQRMLEVMQRQLPQDAQMSRVEIERARQKINEAREKARAQLKNRKENANENKKTVERANQLLETIKLKVLAKRDPLTLEKELNPLKLSLDPDDHSEPDDQSRRAAEAHKLSLNQLLEAAAQLHKSGFDDPASQMEQAAALVEKALHGLSQSTSFDLKIQRDEQLKNDSFDRPESDENILDGSKPEKSDELSGTVDRLQDDVAQIRKEMGELRDMLNRLLSDRDSARSR